MSKIVITIEDKTPTAEDIDQMLAKIERTRNPDGSVPADVGVPAGVNIKYETDHPVSGADLGAFMLGVPTGLLQQAGLKQATFGDAVGRTTYDIALKAQKRLADLLCSKGGVTRQGSLSEESEFVGDESFRDRMLGSL